MAIQGAGLRITSGVVSMAVGSLAVLTLLGVMNAPSEMKKDVAPEKVARFSVERKQPEPKQKPRERRQRRASKAKPRAHAPAAPRVGNALSSLSFGLDTGGLAGVSDIDRSLLGDTEGVAMTADTVDTQPVALERTAPEIPLRLRKRGVSGSVLLTVLVETDGSVSQVKVLSSEPAGVYDDIAVQAVKTWRFRPGSNQGRPYAVWIKVPFEFQY